VTLQKYFSHPSLVIYLFSNPNNKSETGTANRWETTNSKPTGQIVMIGQLEHARWRLMFFPLRKKPWPPFQRFYITYY
jgi:hypothetical protein